MKGLVVDPSFLIKELQPNVIDLNDQRTEYFS